MYKRYIKRFIDVIISFCLLLIFSPFFIAIALIILLFQRQNPFYSQKRPGKNQKEFHILKFKSMTDKKDENGNLLPDSKRITTIGKIIRKTSLDELPQLINVLKGDMSIIGPRPLLFDYIPLYQLNQIRRHEVRPGITGWAQVNGRNTISWTKKFEYDVWYVDNLSPSLDLKILLLTIKKVFLRQNTEFDKAEGNRRFNGYN